MSRYEVLWKYISDNRKDEYKLYHDEVKRISLKDKSVLITRLK